MKNLLPCFYCLVMATDDVRVTRATVNQDIRSGAAFKTSDFAKKSLGGVS